MSFITHIIGYPSIGKNRELKFSIENFLSSSKFFIQELKLLKIIRKIRFSIIKLQKSKIDIVNFSNFPYDRMMTHMLYLGIIPKRFNNLKKINLKEYLEISKGKGDKKPLEMTKWFDTNYHYSVPEFDLELNIFKKNRFIDEDLLTTTFRFFKSKSKFPLIGPISFILLGKNKFVKKEKLIINVFRRYKIILDKINNSSNIDYIQFEEPILSNGLDNFKKKLIKKFYKKIKINNVFFTTYFFSICKNFIKFFKNFKFYCFHFEYEKKISYLNIKFFKSKFLSIGIINGRNIWKTDLKKTIESIKKFKKLKLKKTFLSMSSSLEHIPLTTKKELFPKKISKWFSFSEEKLDELNIIKKIITFGKNKFRKKYLENKFLIISKKEYLNKNYNDIKKYEKILNKNLTKKIIKNFPLLPILPTTTIGSFPQTNKIRSTRLLFKKRKISYSNYEKIIKENIKKNILFQESIGIDVLVHGEPERSDMVEFFCESLGGCLITKNGWVHSYGTRCVKPPIIYGNVKYINNITVKWIKYAISLTNKYLKGIVTGPVTILKWSFIREDIKPKYIALQISLAIRKEIKALKNIGIKIIQIDEPALKECMPLLKKKIKNYISWSTKVFRLTFNNIRNLQIHTHICYSNLDIKDIFYFSKLGVDVVSIESSRSFMKILDVIKGKKLNFEIGLGLYDIHSNYCPSKKSFLCKINKIMKFSKKIWINPDCGLKTRKWKEIKKPLLNMVKATKKIRKNL